MIYKSWLVFILAASLFLGGCTKEVNNNDSVLEKSNQPVLEQPTGDDLGEQIIEDEPEDLPGQVGGGVSGSEPSVGLANPASANCVEQGGKLEIKTKSDGSQYGVCYFEDNRQCEEWALFRGECPVGGVKVTGYENEFQVYCAVTGGVVDVLQKTCTKNKKSCALETYYNNACISEDEVEKPADKPVSTEPTKNFCSPESRGAEVCPQIYGPVCGWFDDSIRCFKYPCAQNFSNSCEACAQKNVAFWTNGSCPN